MLGNGARRGSWESPLLCLHARSRKGLEREIGELPQTRYENRFQQRVVLSLTRDAAMPRVHRGVGELKREYRRQAV
jgi:hypothetical protein